MKIRAVETYFLRHRLPRAIGPSTLLYPFREAVLVKISTDEGIVGWGETGARAGVRALIEEQLGPLLIGRDPLRHREIWQQLWGHNFGDGWAVGAIDIALNDLRGKALNLPIAELYGGRLRERVPAYGSSLNYTEGLDPVDHYPEDALGFVDRGLLALKMRIGGNPMAQDLAAATAVRDAVGPDIKLMADGNGAYTLSAALQMGKELERLGFYWFEEPLPQPGYIGYETLTSKLDIALAAGEVLDSRIAFQEVLQRRAMNIVQPDICLCGGFAECLFVAELARLWGASCAPHCWAGAIVNTATIHLLSVLPNTSWSRTTETPMLELDVTENPFRDEIVSEPIQVREGFVDVPKGPGLGIEILEDVVRRYAV